MSTTSDTAPNIAVFCDYENVAIGVKDAKYESFDIGLVLERLLDKGKIVVKKAYADWDRYKQAKRGMHEAAFELIEIPHVSYSGKNSADIRMVVDALDLCYTKSHVDLFVIVSGDSDFSPLVSKLRENNKMVIGLGVKNSSSDLLMDNCDDFIYYDDLVRRPKRPSKSRTKAKAKKADDAPVKKVDPSDKGDKGDQSNKADKGDKTSGKANNKKPKVEAPGDKQEAFDLVLDTVEALFRERDDNLWGSMVKQTIKRKRPNFSETYYGYKSFNQLLEDAQKSGLLELQRDAKSGGYLIIGWG